MKRLVTIAALFLAASCIANAAGNADAGATKIEACMACHGAHGKAVAPMYPNLAGQNALYLEHALEAYRDGRRRGGTADIMAPQAANLSDEDIADIAAYYSEQCIACSQ
ncbi:MAG: cytochrome c [Nitrococcus sp.]|nr:cytochrome c [Nitrococcus sp.]